jgi:uncharacterized protein YdbL (DUF1318 family)
MKKILVLLSTCLLLIMQPAYAIDLQQAKDQGLVGETTSGYLEAVNSPTPEIKTLIKSINAQRKAKFQEIATSNNTSLETVEKLAGKKAIEKSDAGAYIKLDGSWQKK